MANLHVQPKRRSYVWVWIIVILIIIAAAVYYYVNYYRKGQTTVTNHAFLQLPKTQPVGLDHFNIS